MTKKPPNILFIVMDTARAQNLSCYGHKRETTPNIDRFATEAVQYEKLTSVSPWTLPSHASLFTGTPPSVHQTNSLRSKLPENLETIPRILSRNGYQTVGMAANPWLSSEFGVTRGFDDFIPLFGPFATDSYREFSSVITDGSTPLNQRIRRLLSNQSSTEIFKNCLTAAHRQLFDQRDDGASTAVTKGIDVFHSSSPFFLFINFLEPHLPFHPPDDYKRKFLPENVTEDRINSLNHDAPAYNVRNIEMENRDFALLERLYDAELNYVDDKISELLKKLDDQGIMDDTMIIITGDHGENIGDHGLLAHHYSVHETLTHVPLIIQYPSNKLRSDESNRRWSLDIPATIYDIVSDYGITNETFEEQQYGTSLIAEPNSDRPIFSEYLNPMPPIDRMEAKCHNPEFDVSQYDRTLRAVYEDEMKFVRGSDGYRALHDLSVDYGEGINRISDLPARAKEMEKKLNQWTERCESESVTGSGVDSHLEEQLGNLGYL